MKEHRTYAKPLYPGSLFPEEGASLRVAGMSAEEIADYFSEVPGWFAVEITEQNWQVWKTGEGDEKWSPAEDGTRKVWRIYIGELLTSDAVTALPGDHEILLANMRDNGWDRVVRTRRGNFQPLNESDVVFTEAEVMS